MIKDSAYWLAAAERAMEQWRICTLAGLRDYYEGRASMAHQVAWELAGCPANWMPYEHWLDAQKRRAA